MTPIHPNTISASLLALPVAMAFSRRLLLTCKSPITATASAVDVKIKTIESRANKMTETLRGIEGYKHGGLND